MTFKGERSQLGLSLWELEVVLEVPWDVKPVVVAGGLVVDEIVVVEGPVVVVSIGVMMRP